MSGYIGPLPVPQGIQRKQSFTATASQTTFNTNGYTDGAFINVYLNGVRLINGTDYTATNGSDIVLTTGASASDVLDFETFDTFELVNQTFENITTKNPTHEDTDGGRESAISFKGEQSGGEISTLAQIQASHDGTSDDQKGDLIFKTNDGSDNDAPTEAARIDSDRHFIVGKSAADAGVTAGIELRNDGNARFTKAGATATFNRLTSDGSVATFQKDGTTVGNIAARVGHLRIGNDDIGLEFHKTNNAIYPANLTAGTLPDNTTDLGASNIRFKDIYTSGGIYLGAASNSTPVAANYLDDYEEGTWTPSIEGAGSAGTYTYAEQQGHYVKVGNLVTAWINLTNITSSSVGTSTLLITGLPFAANYQSGFNGDGVGTLSINGYSGLDGDYIAPVIGDNNSKVTVYFHTGTNNTLTSLPVTNLAQSGSADIRGVMHYFTGG